MRHEDRSAQDFPGPMRRRGPRPLALHLAHATAMRAATAIGPTSPLTADPALIAGIAAYRRHPFARTLVDPPTIWAEGEARLLDYSHGETALAATVLFVPSLINRAYVLDLIEGRSMLRWFAASGIRTVLLDWGWPERERAWTLTDYVAGRLDRVIDAVAGPVVLAGYCMGGLLALAAGLRRPDAVRGIAFLATPWDFHAGIDPDAWTGIVPALEPLMALSGTLPVDALQTMLAHPTLDEVADRYRAFGTEPQDSFRAQNFVALEDWLADGIPLAAPVAREVLGGWYGENTPATGRWRVADVPVDPRKLGVPAFVAIPGRDRIVPPESARALAAKLPNATVHHAEAGHVGMVAGSQAESQLWTPLREWLRTLASGPGAP